MNPEQLLKDLQVIQSVKTTKERNEVYTIQLGQELEQLENEFVGKYGITPVELVLNFKQESGKTTFKLEQKEAK